MSGPLDSGDPDERFATFLPLAFAPELLTSSAHRNFERLVRMVKELLKGRKSRHLSFRQGRHFSETQLNRFS
jgi:hypothetical protein